MNEEDVEQINRLKLEPHPEGGWFRRIYTASSTVLVNGSARPTATSIYYSLNRDQPIGRLHRNRSDILHFLIDGGPIEYVTVDADGDLHRIRLGGHAVAGADDRRFLMVPGGHWKAAQLVEGSTHALIAEVVTPGFDFADHTFASVDAISEECPQHLHTLRAYL